MNLEEIKKRLRLPWSDQAMAILAGLSEDFPVEEFEEYVIRTKFIVGGAYVNEFLQIILEKKKQEENLRKIKNVFPDSKQI